MNIYTCSKHNYTGTGRACPDCKFEATANFVSIAELSDEEQIKLYIKQPKRKLAEMLTAANKIIKSFSKFNAIILRD